MKSGDALGKLVFETYPKRPNAAKRKQKTFHLFTEKVYSTYPTTNTSKLEKTNSNNRFA